MARRIENQVCHKRHPLAANLVISRELDWIFIWYIPVAWPDRFLPTGGT